MKKLLISCLTALGLASACQPFSPTGEVSDIHGQVNSVHFDSPLSLLSDLNQKLDHQPCWFIMIFNCLFLSDSKSEKTGFSGFFLLTRTKTDGVLFFSFKNPGPEQLIVNWAIRHNHLFFSLEPVENIQLCFDRLQFIFRPSHC